MKETILDVLMFMFQSYVDDNEEVELDKESLHKNLSDAGFADDNIERAFEWLEGLPGADENSLLNKPTKCFKAMPLLFIPVVGFISMTSLVSFFEKT